jgi:hypothetical protein
METVKVKVGNHKCETFMIVSEGMKSCRISKQVSAFINFIKNNKDIVYFSRDSFTQSHPSDNFNCTFHFDFERMDGYSYGCALTPSGIFKFKNRLTHDGQNPTVVRIPENGQYSGFNMIPTKRKIKYDVLPITQPKSCKESMGELLLCVEVNKKIGITNY